MHVSLQRLKQHIFISYSVVRLTPRRKDERARRLWACDCVACEFPSVMRRRSLICHSAGSAGCCPILFACGLNHARNQEQSKLFPSWDAWLPGPSVVRHQRVEKVPGKDCCANQESLPPSICYTRRHLHPRLLMESAENKFGTVQFFLERLENAHKKRLFESIEDKPHLASHHL